MENDRDYQPLICTWEEFRKYSQIVANQIEKSQQVYTQIIAIARGGFYLGDYLSRYFHLPLAVIVTQSYGDDNRQQQLRIGDLSYVNTPHDRLLLVDDLLDTGITMMVVKNQLIDKWKVEIDTAVIWQKPHSQYQADYYYTITADDRWIVQPFEL